MTYVANPPLPLSTGPEPLVAADTWRPVMQAASFQCQCAGGCGKTHAKDPGGRCPKKHRDNCRLVASAPRPTDNPHADAAGPLIAYCPSCYDGHRRVFNRGQKALTCPAEPLPFEVADP